MKKTIVGLFLILLFLLFGNLTATPPVCAQDTPMGADIRVSQFYSSLQPYGEWILNDTYGWVWSPYNLPVHWRPYTDGYWVNTDYGWSWVSDQPWGWACFHYGRWFYDRGHGWLWYPDTVWAPAWVAWRTGGEYIGWAPLPPKAIWRASNGLEFSESDAQGISWHAYNFCNARDFTDSDLAGRFIEHARNVTLIGETNITANTIMIEDGQVVNRVPFHEMIVRAVGHPIPYFRIARAESPEGHGMFGSELRVFRPEVKVKDRLVVTVPAKAEPVELMRRHKAEMNSLQVVHQNDQRTLEVEHNKEMKSPPPGKTKEQLLEQHKVENNALQEQMQRERELLQSQHERETRIATLSKVPPQHHIVVPAPQVHSNEKTVTKGRQASENEKDKDRGKDGR